MALVREDESGLYVRAGGYIGRPGKVVGYSARMDSGGLNKGDKVKATHMSQTQLIKITLVDGTVLYWFTGH